MPSSRFGYPTAHRSGSSGFQSSGATGYGGSPSSLSEEARGATGAGGRPSTYPPGYRPPPMAAQVPVNAGELVPYQSGPTPSANGRAASGLSKGARAAARALGMGMRMHPLLGRAMDLMELWDLYQELNPEDQSLADYVPGEFSPGPGWELAHECGVPPHLGPKRPSVAPVTSVPQPCGLESEGIPDGMNTHSVSGQAWTIYLGPDRSFSSSRFVSSWWVASMPATVPEGLPFQQPGTARPSVAPGVVTDPASLPIGQAVGTPQQMPWSAIPRRRPNPWRAEQSDRGYRPPGTPVRLANPPPLPRRPLPGEKERKFVGAIAAGSILGRALHGVTETKDLIEAVWAALPDGCKHGRTPQAKAIDVYRCAGELDVEQALTNVALNWVEDALLGGVGRRIGQANRASGRSFGFTIGPAL